MRAVVYARYSSDLQSEASIADQIEVCRRYAVERGWIITQTYTDAAISGASRFRPAFQQLLNDAGRKLFDIVLCEAVDRLGRRLADTADLQDRLSFHGVKLFTPSIGEVTQIHVAVMGMMAQMALKDLAEKTRRGQLGRVLKGKSPGGLAYGYRIAAADDGRGGREIDFGEAETVRRIFREFAAGASPEAIAKRLNKESIPGPGGRPWSNTTLRGQADRGTGLLNNALYRGVLKWNRCSYVKDPRTGRRIARPNPQESWEIQAVPHRRIVDEALWEAAKARQEAMRATLKRPDTSNGLNELHRARFLLSGLMRCRCCGGGYTIIAKDRYGCATRKQKGTCDNTRTISRREIEARVLEGLKDRLLAPDLVAEFIKAVQDELCALRRERKTNDAQRTRKLTEIDRKISGMMRAIEDGLYEPSMKERLKALQNERRDLEVDVAETAEAELTILSHPNLPELYRRKVEQLEAILEGPDRAEAMDLIRSMIDRIELCPRAEANGLDAILHGDLAAILAACAGAAQKENAPDLAISGRRLSVVAGAGFEPATFRL
ncbi:recombinase family protein [Rhodoblastus acidophilus]|uniref:Recombinase family protein n=1 Tax=Candidatus Rhodoblastus alkanivorans TaxID=2954117 RepID=A0ABS9Z6H4_9HYPH|nr:recombinase family protein [Candidatus Rhodoblastus alkanivorans]MCI4682237.1 recombinase family protein [Candidatus Rhodoblastus alkanivorans]MDI4639539.1 recombinase family protein [Rhodoblastus acidophilus]